METRPLSTAEHRTNPPPFSSWDGGKVDFVRCTITPTIDGWIFTTAAVAGIVLALGAATLLVYETGGTQTAYPYLILLPVIFAAAVFKMPGGVTAAVAAALLLGPWMPLNVQAETMQPTTNWLIRLGMYVLIGAFTGLMATMLDIAHRTTLSIERTDPSSGLISATAGACSSLVMM